MAAAVVPAVEARRKRGAAVISVRAHGAKGDGKRDDTEAFQKAIDALPAAGGTVAVPAGVYIIDPVRSVHLRDRMRLSLDPQAQLVAKPNAAKRAYVLTVHGKSDVEVSGGRILGDRDLHRGQGGEWGHGIMIRGAERVTVSSMHISRCWGDGISIGGISGPPSIPSRDVVIVDVTCDGNRRQGLTIGRSRQVRVLRSTFTNTGGTLPACGIDVEPDATDIARTVLIDQCLVSGNEGAGIQLYHRVVDATIRRCTIRNNRGAGIFVVGARGSLIVDNRIVGNGQRGLAVRGKSSDLEARGNRFSKHGRPLAGGAGSGSKVRRHVDIAESTSGIRLAPDNVFE